MRGEKMRGKGERKGDERKGKERKGKVRGLLRSFHHTIHLQMIRNTLIRNENVFTC